MIQVLTLYAVIIALSFVFYSWAQEIEYEMLLQIDKIKTVSCESPLYKHLEARVSRLEGH